MIAGAYIISQHNQMFEYVAQVGDSIIGDVQVGALLGFSATLLAAFGVWYLDKRNRRKRLRKALIAELEKQDERFGRIVESLEADSAVGSDDNGYEVEPSDLPPADSLPTTIYESNASNLGELSSEEVEAVVNYYATLQTQKATIRAIREDEIMLTADKKDLHEDMPKLDRSRDNLISTLEGNSWRERLNG